MTWSTDPPKLVTPPATTGTFLGFTQGWWEGNIRWITTSAAMYALGRGWISAEMAPQITLMVVAALPLFWTWYAHTKTNTIKAAEKLPEVKMMLITDQSISDATSNKVGTPADFHEAGLPVPIPLSAAAAGAAPSPIIR